MSIPFWIVFPLLLVAFLFMVLLDDVDEYHRLEHDRERSLWEPGED
jgi:hypothetical protein